MDTTTAKEVLASKKAENANEAAFLALMEQLLETGWQSDQKLVSEGIAAGVDSALAPATDISA